MIILTSYSFNNLAINGGSVKDDLFHGGRRL
jgi:hypothetical protein